MAANAQTAEETPPVIHVIGHIPETHERERGGQSVVVTPREPTRYATDTHLKEQSSLSLPETGHISPSGFIVPRVRGQDANLTEVYVEDMLVQDPYTGLPLIEDLDLRAFGQLEIDEGLSPADLSSLNPIGALRFRLRPLTENAVAVGGETGAPYGASGWGKVDGIDPRDGLGASLYARTHETPGRFPYYSDNATPYNPSDDHTLWRTNNDQRSWQVLPRLELTSPGGTWRLLGLIQQSHRGLPGLSPNAASEARATEQNALGTLAWHDTLTGPLWVSAALSTNRERREVDDPTQAVLVDGQKSRFVVQAKRESAAVHWGHDEEPIVASAGVDVAQAQVQGELTGTRSTQDVRHNVSYHAGIAASLPLALRLEAKALVRGQSDERSAGIAASNTEASGALQRSLWSRGAGSSLAYIQEHYLLYLQAAHFERPASLLEEFGNGGLVRPNTDLMPENQRHWEAGAALREGSSYRVGLALYQDDTSDKIVFVPAVGGALRAVNVQSTRLRGIDLKADAKWADTAFGASLSRLSALDVTAPSVSFLLPEVAPWQSSGMVTQTIGAGTLRWLTRYRSQIYRDLRDTIAVPAATISDASADYEIHWGHSDVQVGFAVLNVFNVMRLPIEGSGGGSLSQGYTAYSEVTGYPLPGRQWKLSFSAGW